MKQIKYYCFDENSNLKEISEEDEIIKTYNSSGIEVASWHGYEAHQLLKLTILPVDIKLAPLKELPIDYGKRNKLQKQSWLESRERNQKIIDEHKANKGPDQEKLIRFKSPSEGYFAEYDKKNDPRNRVDISKGIFNKRKRGKRSSPQNETMV
jgi:hypothetical protein